MSLLVPTLNDYEDAHGETAEDELFQSKFTALRATPEGKRAHPWTFEVVQGFFKQSDPATDDLHFNYVDENAGRLKSWQLIMSELDLLNANAADNELYKLVLFARHGQGYHNVVVEKYGLEEWERKWRSLTTDGEFIYAPDPELTKVGIAQAKENNELWKQEVALGAPIPAKFYVSPMQRSSQTLVITWDDIKPRELHPIVREDIRERIGVNLCDKRSPRAVIEERFSKYGFEIADNVTEQDEQFTDTYREKLHEQAVRADSFLQFLFDEDFKGGKVDKKLAQENKFISTTSHAGMIRSFILALGHRHFTILTGGMIPVVIKAKRE